MYQIRAYQAHESVLDPRKKRASAGTVTIESFRGRLRFRHAGKAYSLSLGLAATLVNQRVARMKADRITLDIASGHFDTSLKSYQTASTTSDDTQGVGA